MEKTTSFVPVSYLTTSIALSSQKVKECTWCIRTYSTVLYRYHNVSYCPHFHMQIKPVHSAHSFRSSGTSLDTKEGKRVAVNGQTIFLHRRGPWPWTCGEWWGGRGDQSGVSADMHELKELTLTKVWGRGPAAAGLSPEMAGVWRRRHLWRIWKVFETGVCIFVQYYPLCGWYKVSKHEREMTVMGSRRSNEEKGMARREEKRGDRRHEASRRGRELLGSERPERRICFFASFFFHLGTFPLAVWVDHLPRIMSVWPPRKERTEKAGFRSEIGEFKAWHNIAAGNINATGTENRRDLMITWCECVPWGSDTRIKKCQKTRSSPDDDRVIGDVQKWMRRFTSSDLV
jgi:hypothetical protein